MLVRRENSVSWCVARIVCRRAVEFWRRVAADARDCRQNNSIEKWARADGSKARLSTPSRHVRPTLTHPGSIRLGLGVIQHYRLTHQRHGGTKSIGLKRPPSRAQGKRVGQTEMRQSPAIPHPTTAIGICCGKSGTGNFPIIGGHDHPKQPACVTRQIEQDAGRSSAVRVSDVLVKHVVSARRSAD